MERLGIIRGSNKFDIEKLAKFEEQRIQTSYGTAEILVSDKCVVLPRHGLNNNIPPHKINHLANMLSFTDLDVNRIVSFTSVGSLKLSLPPTYLVMPDDYINLGTILTYFNEEIKHIIPGLNTQFRTEIYNKIVQLPIKLQFNGIYIQTQGPRLETKAEINMLKNYGDIVGMTMASEATLAKEQGLKYANISVVDNYCNGIIEEPLTMDVIKKNQVENVKTIEKIIKKLLGEY